MTNQVPKPHMAPGRAAVGSILLIVAVCILGWELPSGWNWIAVMILITAFLAMLGYATTGRLTGIFINERKLMSLSRFQFVIWTVIVLSAYFIIALARAKSVGMGEGVAEPLVVKIDWQVWTLLGISAASLVGSPLVNSGKKRKDPRDQEKIKEKLNSAFGDTPKEVDENREGLLYGNTDVFEARFTDMFEGEEVGNTEYIDLARVQMFLFTMIVAAVYAVQVFQLITLNDLLANDVALPTIPDGLLTLMGISHGGYLGTKSIDQTPVGPVATSTAKGH